MWRASKPVNGLSSSNTSGRSMSARAKPARCRQLRGTALGMGACALLPRMIGQGRASELLFTGRAMSADAPAKYLNSNDTELFHKGQVLYNLARARSTVALVIAGSYTTGTLATSYGDSRR